MERIERKEFAVAIIGAGIHGITQAIGCLKLNPDVALCIVDSEEICGNWFRTTARMGMRELRSFWNHSLLKEPEDLLGFAVKSGINTDDLNPPLEAFNQYLRWLIDRYRITEHKISASVTDLRRDDSSGKYVLELRHNDGSFTEIKAKNVILALGLGSPRIPPVFGVGDSRIVHSHHFDLRQIRNRQPQNVLIVGAALTGATLAVNLHEMGFPVTIINDGPIRVKDFFGPEWFGGHKFKEFILEESPHKRLKMINQELKGGSMTRSYYAKLMELVGKNLKVRENVRIESIESCGEFVRVSDLGEFSRVILATGYCVKKIQDVGFLSPLRERIRELEGLPVLSEHLEMLPRLFVSGQFAMLGMGVIAPFIIGAHFSAKIIAPKILS